VPASRRRPTPSLTARTFAQSVAPGCPPAQEQSALDDGRFGGSKGLAPRFGPRVIGYAGTVSATAWGPIALLGSGEFEPWAKEGERLILSAATGDGSVAILPLASSPEGETYADWAHKGLEHFDELGVPARVIEVKESGDAFKREVFDQLERASLTFFSGGNPAYLADSVTGTPLGRALLDALERGAALAGCSAGACLMGEAAPESVTDRIDEHLWVAGLRLLPSVWVVPHWDALREDVCEYFLTHIPAEGIAVGIDESTMLVRIADSWSIHGKGSVFVRADGRAMRARPGDMLAPGALPVPIRR
jgi:cyanophycinase